MITSNLCIECGCDTTEEGFVNRIPADDGYICGNCLAQWDYEHDLLVADGDIGLEFANDTETVLGILRDRAIMADSEEVRTEALLRACIVRTVFDCEWQLCLRS